MMQYELALSFQIDFRAKATVHQSYLNLSHLVTENSQDDFFVSLSFFLSALVLISICIFLLYHSVG